MGKFRKLKVWQRGKDLAVSIYKTTGGGPFAKDFGLRDQIRRAAVSIPSNIAEGDELGTDKQGIRQNRAFFSMRDILQSRYPARLFCCHMPRKKYIHTRNPLSDQGL